VRTPLKFSLQSRASWHANDRDVLPLEQRRPRPGGVVDQVAPGATSFTSRAYVSAFMATMMSTRLSGRLVPSLVTRISYQVGRPWMLEGSSSSP